MNNSKKPLYTNSLTYKNQYEFGLKGQNFVELKFNKLGYSVYKRNFKKIGLEIDLIVYKVIGAETGEKVLLVHIVEVKTRNRFIGDLDLSVFNLVCKWGKIRGNMFEIVSNLKKELGLTCPHKITFDLAVVHINKDGCFCMRTYIRDVNLLL